MHTSHQLRHPDMPDHSVPASPAVPHAPPTMRGPIAPPPSIWPNVLGIISIILGIGGLLTYAVCGLGSILLADVFIDLMSGIPGAEASVQSMEQMESWSWVMLLLNLTLGVLAAWLMMSGFGFMMRKPWARKSAMKWAIVRLIVAVPSTVVSYRAQIVQLEAMRENANTGMPFWMDGFMFVSLAIGVLWVISWPIIILWWLNRAKIKQEVAGWTGSNTST